MKRFLEPTVVVSERSTRPVGESSLPGELIGCRQQPSNLNYFDVRSTWIGDLGIIPVPPDCPASRILHASFERSGRLTIIEDWVNSVIGEHDRSRIYGRTAVARAKKKMHVKHYEDDDMLHYGELRLDGCQLKAFIRTGQHEGREMFTMAHELGHAALYLLKPEFDQDAVGTERLCDLFAVELTMPVKLVREIWHNMPDARSIAWLAKKTRSSLTASCIRIAEYRGDITTGLASADGVIQKQYGANLVRNLRFSVKYASRKTSAGKTSWSVSNGLAVSTHPAKNRLVFIARRIR